MKALELLLALPPVKLWILFHLLTLLVFHVGPDSPLKCTLGSLGVYGMQGGEVYQSQICCLIKHVPLQVNGTGPLAGLYELTNSEEPRCQ